MPRHLRLEVTERITADGSVLTPLDEATARAAIAGLHDADVEAVSICPFTIRLTPQSRRH